MSWRKLKKINHSIIDNISKISLKTTTSKLEFFPISGHKRDAYNTLRCSSFIKNKGQKSKARQLLTMHPTCTNDNVRLVFQNSARQILVVLLTGLFYAFWELLLVFDKVMIVRRYAGVLSSNEPIGIFAIRDHPHYATSFENPFLACIY